MPTKEVITQVEGQKVKLTNLDKIIYPEVGISKAELIQFYLQMADFLLPYISQRPLTLIRYPDGVHGERFYSKNKPKWTPKWVNSIDIKDSDGDGKSYVSADTKATLAWLGNLAALELHPMQATREHPTLADHFIFDLDPPENQDNFAAVKDVALRLRDHLRQYDYQPFVKTSGGKGLHLYIPILQQYPQDSMYAAVKSLAQSFIKANPDTTLHMNKEKRAGRILIDIFRNNYAHTCVAPYSPRGKVGAPVSTPVAWDEVPELSSPQAYTIKNIVEKLRADGDAWIDFYQYQRPLHTERATQVAVSPLLEDYLSKRDFGHTPEPVAESHAVPDQQRYCVQLHDASNLHYDLRLEDEGVLKSWAIPKGLPAKLGVKRLAIATEPHPLKYLTFEGVIPAGQYGAGEMWLFDSGRISWIKKEAKKYTFYLQQGKLSGQYALYKTKGKQWIIERKDEANHDFKTYTSPMLAKATENIPSPSTHFYEIKWDGIRCVVTIDHGDIRIYSRNGNDISAQFPLLIAALDEAVEAETAVLDGEIVHLEADGSPNFAKIVGRIHVTGSASIEKASRMTKATMYLFDLLHLDGLDVRPTHQLRRKAWLKTILDTGETIRYSEEFADGEALFAAAQAHQLEGIMCKRKDAPYLSNSRSDHWVKMKVRSEATVTIIGYTQGQGDRAGLVGALHLADISPDGLRYMGKVGTGFDIKLLKEITKKMEALDTVSKPIKENIEEPGRTIWTEAVYDVDIRYASLSSNGTYREPVFLKMYRKA